MNQIFLGALDQAVQKRDRKPQLQCWTSPFGVNFYAKTADTTN
jgi:hypothetical protein